MPKLGRSVCVNKEAHARGVENLLSTIAQRSGKTWGDVVIAYHEDISVYAVRMWLTRPIPKRHWKVLATLSGYSVEQIERLATEHFVNQR